jgi:stearoyl-CoA 9-desaturase NADPH oxidoreductase
MPLAPSLPRPTPSPTRSPSRLLRSALDALAAPHGIDRYLEVVNPRWSTRDVRAVVTSVRHQTADTVTLRIRPNAAWAGFLAGQHVVASVEIDGTWHSRCFSPASSQHASDGELELTVKVNPSGVVSRHVKERARRGAVLRLSPAQGDFTLPTPRPDSVLLISGGSGITPVLSMLRTLCDEGSTRPTTLLHYSFGPHDRLYGPELATLAAAHPEVNVVHAFTEHPGGDLEGLLCRAHLDAVAPARAAAETFVCGPPGLMAAVERLWAEEGNAARLHVEHFAPAPLAPAAREGVGGSLRFARSDRTVADSGATLLDQAEAAGLRPASGCRMGICHTCTSHLAAGCVRDVRNGRTTEAGPTGTAVQLCVHVPEGDVTLDL